MLDRQEPAPSSAPGGVFLPLAATLLAMGCFQGGAALAKQLFPAIGAEGAATLRLGLGAVLLMAVTRPWRNWPRPAPWPVLLGLGISVAVAVQGYYLAIERLPLGVALPLQFLGPLGVAIAGSRRASDLLWAALAAGGVWLLVGARPAEFAFDALGVLYGLAAAAGWAGYILFGRAASAAFGRAAAGLSTAMAAVLLLPLGLAHAGAALFDPRLLPLALAVAALASAVPFSLELYAMPRLPARTFATFTSLEPAIAVLSGWLFLHERLAPLQLAGVALVMAAAAGAAWATATRPAAAVHDPT